MKRIRILICWGLLLILIAPKAQAWGFWAHQRINRLAVFTLPPEMLKLYKTHLEYITEHAVDPDKRRYAVDGEAPRHYIDIDHYGEYPFDEMPRKWYDAEEKFGKDTLEAYGTVPWSITLQYRKLIEAFKNKDLKMIMKYSADIGHYIADSNVPLHTTENYNGQMSGQKGIHGLWESRLPEIFGEDYNYFIGRAKYIENPLDEAWKSVMESHLALDSVLGFERELTKVFPPDRKFSYENRNNYLTRVYSYEFCRDYHEMLNGMVERRARTSILRVGSFWFSAWVEAGQPDLNELLKIPPMEEEKQEYEKKLKIIDREAGDIGLIQTNFDKLFGSCCGHGKDCHKPMALKPEEQGK